MPLLVSIECIVHRQEPDGSEGEFVGWRDVVTDKRVFRYEELAELLELYGLDLKEFCAIEQGRLTMTRSEDENGLPVESVQRQDELARQGRCFMVSYDVYIEEFEARKPTARELAEKLGVSVY